MARSRNSRKGIRPRKSSPAPKRVGNTHCAGCTFCNPRLNTRLEHQSFIRKEMARLKKLTIHEINDDVGIALRPLKV